jgi:hypothetical protein
LDDLLAGTVNVAAHPFLFLCEHVIHYMDGDPQWFGPPSITCTCVEQIDAPLHGHLPECPFRIYRVQFRKMIDPIDRLCEEISRFVMTAGVRRLNRCATCVEYFVAETTAKRLFCSSECRVNGDNIRRERNLQAQRASRKTTVEGDFQELKDGMALLHNEEGYEIIYMSEMRRVTKMNRKRVKTLRAYEFEKNGNTDITDQIVDLFAEGTNERTYSILKFFQVDSAGRLRMTLSARYFRDGVGSSRPS